jgi:glycerophosphoryl diester phosphodiesterase
VRSALPSLERQSFNAERQTRNAERRTAAPPPFRARSALVTLPGMSCLRIGHRGAAGTRPELTAPAFERALEIGVDMIELDVQLTRDEKLVVLHDRELGRTVLGEGAVRDYTLAELCALDAGAWFALEYAGTCVPSLAEVLDLTAGRAELNVEIKSGAADWEATARALIELLREKGRLASTVISSFEMGALRSVREHCAEARIGVLWHNADVEPMWLLAEALAARSIHPLWSLVDRVVVEQAHDRGLQVIVWTVNEPHDIAALAEMGVDGIISDYPERLREALG